MLVRILTGLFFLSLAGAAWGDDLRRDVNYAVGGATTHSGNLSDVHDPAIVHAVRAAGLELGGIDNQIDWLEATLFDVDPHSDVFFVWAGLNNYLSLETDPAVPPAQLQAALERLYNGAGARIFVVPNLFLLGFAPAVVARGPSSVAGLNRLVVEHNLELRYRLAEFARTHPDAVVVPVDMFGAFLSMLWDPAFENIQDSCLEHSLPEGGTCDGYLWLDHIHLRSVALHRFARAAARGLQKAIGLASVRRVITIGDSLSDAGSRANMTLRATGIEMRPSPPYFMNQSSDGPTTVEQFELLIGAQVDSTAFYVPYTTVIAAHPIGHFDGLYRGSLRMDAEAEVFVPGRIIGQGPAIAVLILERVRCVYVGDETMSALALHGCTCGADAGDRIDVGRLELFAIGQLGDALAVRLLHY